MKKRIVNLALATSLAATMIYAPISEAARFSRFDWLKIRNDVKISEGRLGTGVQSHVNEAEEVLGAERETGVVGSVVSENAVNAADFGAVANADYYNPSNGNYYADASFNTPASDATDAINEAIKHASDKGLSTVYIPEGNYLIEASASDTAYVFEHASKGGIRLESNITLQMSNETTLVTDTVSTPGYSLISVSGKENVTIRGGKLVGDMDTHPANTHNYCYGITIANASRNVVVEDVEITKAEDDGIMIVDYLEHLSGGKRVENVTIRNVKSHNNGRQGLTISTGSNIKVLDSEFSDQKKHSPMSGIDIELESYDHIGVSDVEISGNTFNGNAYSGVVISDMFNDQPGSMSRNVQISNNKVNGSRFGIIASGKVDSLEISNNDINIDHPVNEFSAALGSTSANSRNVNIANNTVSSSSRSNHTIGAISMTPSANITGNSFTGQKKGIVSYTDGVNISNNLISNMIEMPFEITGNANSLSSNQVK